MRRERAGVSADVIGGVAGVAGCGVVVLGVVSTSSASVGSTCGGVSIRGSAGSAVRPDGMLTGVACDGGLIGHVNGTVSQGCLMCGAKLRCCGLLLIVSDAGKNVRRKRLFLVVSLP